MKSTKRIFVLAFAAVFTLLSAVGCNSKQISGTTGKSETSGVEKSGTFPIVQKPITIKILKQRGVTEVPCSEMEVFKAYEMMTNIKVEWDTPASDFTAQYNLVMASGDLPDVVMDMPRNDLVKYADQGVIIPLNDLLTQNAPNLEAWMGKRPDLRKGMMQADGKYYYFPMFDETLSGNNSLAVREDWLQKLNLKQPVTADDWMKVWKAFKEMDPNGNGKKDEIPFSAPSKSHIRQIAGSWGVVDGFYTEPRDGGKVHYGPIETRYREALEWLNQAYQLGYIDPEYTKLSDSTFKTKMSSNLIGSFRGSNGGHLATFNSTLPQTLPGFHAIGAEPIKGPYGDQIHHSVDQPMRSTIGAVITKNSKYAKEIVRWLDYFYGPEGSLMLNFGIEGKTYTMKDGKPVFTDYVMKNPDGKPYKEVIGTMSYIQTTGPYVLLKAGVEQADTKEINDAKQRCIIPFIEQSSKRLLPSGLIFSTQDDTAKNQIMDEVNKYVNDNVDKFITGQQPFSVWDDYVKNVRKMGIDKVNEIYQKSVDDWNKK